MLEKPGKKPEKKRSVMGAPSKGDDARTISFHCKISKNELVLWKKLADKAGKTLGAFVLEPIREKHPTKPGKARKTNKERE